MKTNLSVHRKAKSKGQTVKGHKPEQENCEKKKQKAAKKKIYYCDLTGTPI